MDATAFLLMAENSFGIPYSVKESSSPEYSSYTCVSDVLTDGIFYDYSISLDDDYEVIGASIGLASAGANDTDLFYAADLYFYGVAVAMLDGSDKDTLISWLETTLPQAADGKSSIVLGGAIFEVYCTGSMYFMDISAAS